MKKAITIIISIVFIATCINGLFNQTDKERYKVYIGKNNEIVREGKKPPSLTELLPYLESTQIQINIKSITREIKKAQEKAEELKNQNSNTAWYEKIIQWLNRIAVQLQIIMLNIVLVISYPINAILTLSQLIYLLLTYGA